MTETRNPNAEGKEHLLFRPAPGDFDELTPEEPAPAESTIILRPGRRRWPSGRRVSKRVTRDDHGVPRWPRTPLLACSTVIALLACVALALTLSSKRDSGRDRAGSPTANTTVCAKPPSTQRRVMRGRSHASHRRRRPVSRHVPPAPAPAGVASVVAPAASPERTGAPHAQEHAGGPFSP